MVGLTLRLRTNLRSVWYMAMLKKCGLIEERVNKIGEKRIEVKRLKWKSFFDRFGIDAEVEQVKVKETTARCSLVRIGVKPREGRVKNAGQQLKANEILPPRHEHICSLWRKLSRELGESIPGAIAQEEGRDVTDSESDHESDTDDGSFLDESDFEIDTSGSTAACQNGDVDANDNTDANANGNNDADGDADGDVGAGITDDDSDFNIGDERKATDEFERCVEAELGNSGENKNTHYPLLEKLGICTDMSIPKNYEYVKKLIGELVSLQSNANSVGEREECTIADDGIVGENTVEYYLKDGFTTVHAVTVRPHRSDSAFHEYHRKKTYLKELICVMGK